MKAGNKDWLMMKYVKMKEEFKKNVFLQDGEVYDFVGRSLSRDISSEIFLPDKAKKTTPVVAIR